MHSDLVLDPPSLSASRHTPRMAGSRERCSPAPSTPTTTVCRRLHRHRESPSDGVLRWQLGRPMTARRKTRPVQGVQLRGRAATVFTPRRGQRAVTLFLDLSLRQTLVCSFPQHSVPLSHLGPFSVKTELNDVHSIVGHSSLTPTNCTQHTAKTAADQTVLIRDRRCVTQRRAGFQSGVYFSDHRKPTSRLSKTGMAGSLQFVRKRVQVR